ncbi:MAG: cytochrome c [Candidatus Zixiibacteriota bacterium]
MRTGRLIHAACAAAVVSLLMIACGPTGSGEEKSPGEMAFRRSCQTCHSLPKPSKKTDEEWPALVRRYGEKAKLSPETIAQITEYLRASN